MAREEYVQLAGACDFLEHYHEEHTNDIVTRFKGKRKNNGVGSDIYVVSDPEWKEKMRQFTDEIFGK